MVEFNGTKNNNLIPSAPISVFLDASAPQQERYKGVLLDHIAWQDFLAFIKKHPDRWEHRALRKDAGFVAALFGYVSPDGLHWRRLAEPFTVEHSDTQVVGTYDTVRKKYVIYTRNWFVGPRAREAPPDPSGMSWLGESRGAGRRAIGITESDRFGDFPLSRVLLVPRPDMAASELLYTNGYTTIPGAPDHRLLFPTIWDTSDDSTRLEMASSHDGQTWNWMPGGTLMETGRFGRFDGGSVFWNVNLIELANGDFALPYSGYADPHKYPRGAWSYRPGYAVWPKGRLVAVAAPDRGEFTTVSLLPPGKRLRINAVTKRAGSILVAVTRRNGTFLPGHSFADALPVIGDQYRTLVRWRGTDDLGAKPNEPICLRFRMSKARIYALDFEAGD